MIVLVYTHEVISTKSEWKPLKMEKRRFESFEVFSCRKKVNTRILSTFKKSFFKKMVKKNRAHTLSTR